MATGCSRSGNGADGGKAAAFFRKHVSRVPGRALRVAAAILGVVVCILANDTSVTKGAGGLVPVRSGDIAMESEDLRISLHGISIDYVFRNVSARDADVTVAFPLPLLDGSELANVPVALPSHDPVNFVDFRVTSDGKPVPVSVETRAFFDDGKDLTSELQSLGLPLSPVDAVAATQAFMKLPVPTRDALLKRGLFDCPTQPKGICEPYWQMRAQFFWKQHFPAGRAVRLHHEYLPVVGGSFLTATDDGSANVAPYCGGRGALDQIQAAKKRHPDPKAIMLERRIQYILSTANNWRGPMGRFHLSVETDSADDILLSCLPGLGQVAPTRYELSRANFRPDRELDVLILQSPK